MSTKNLTLIPTMVKKRLERGDLTAMEEKKMRCILSYSSTIKLRSVVRWRERMAKHGITSSVMAARMGVARSKVSEWINFTHEPTDKTFDKFEEILYKLGA